LRSDRVVAAASLCAELYYIQAAAKLTDLCIRMRDGFGQQHIVRRERRFEILSLDLALLQNIHVVSTYALLAYHKIVFADMFGSQGMA